MSQLSHVYDFMTADYKYLLADNSPEAVEQLEWLLPTASRLVEREAARRGVSQWQLFQDQHEIEDPAVRHALDILEAGEFIVPDAVSGSAQLKEAGPDRIPRSPHRNLTDQVIE